MNGKESPAEKDRRTRVGIVKIDVGLIRVGVSHHRCDALVETLAHVGRGVVFIGRIVSARAVEGIIAICRSLKPSGTLKACARICYASIRIQRSLLNGDDLVPIERLRDCRAISKPGCACCVSHRWIKPLPECCGRAQQDVIGRCQSV